MTTNAPGASYAAAGVDIEAGETAVRLMKEWVAKAQRPESVGGLGGFAGLFDASALTANTPMTSPLDQSGSAMSDRISNACFFPTKRRSSAASSRRTG